MSVIKLVGLIYLFSTFKDIRYTALEVNKCWIFKYSVLLGNGEVFCLDEHDSMAIAVVINVLQLFQDSSAVGALIVI